MGQQKNHSPGLEYEGSSNTVLLIEDKLGDIISTSRCDIGFAEVGPLVLTETFPTIS